MFTSDKHVEIFSKLGSDFNPGSAAANLPDGNFVLRDLINGGVSADKSSLQIVSPHVSRSWFSPVSTVGASVVPHQFFGTLPVPPLRRAPKSW